MGCCFLVKLQHENLGDGFVYAHFNDISQQLINFMLDLIGLRLCLTGCVENLNA